jgi:hypothetical protein
VWVPRLEQVEALTLEVQYFVECILSDQNPFNDGRAGLRVVQMLEAIDQSMTQNGKMIYCHPARSKVMVSAAAV